MSSDPSAPPPPAPPPPPEDGEPRPPREGDLDEVGFAIGPDEGGGGLFDRSGSDATGTGESTASTARPDLAATAQRTALLAWLAADLPDVEAPEESTEPGFQPPPELAEAPAEALSRLGAALRRALADEPLDPLPALDGIGGGVWPEAARALERVDTTHLVDATALPDESSTTAFLAAPLLPAPVAPLPEAPRPAEPPSRSASPDVSPQPARAGLGGLDGLLAVVLAAVVLAYLFAGR